MRRTFFAILTFVVAVTSATVFLSSDKAAASVENIISDATFINENAMNEGQIAAFINRFPKSCLLPQNYPQGLSPISFIEPNSYFDHGTQQTSAARIINKMSKFYHINPQVILTTLEKEQALVSGSQGCATWRYNSAMGYNCPDNSENSLKSYPDLKIYNTCVQNPGNAGFARQVNRAAWQLRFDQERAYGNLSWGGDGNVFYYGRMTEGWRSRQQGQPAAYYDGIISIGGRSFKVANGATAALYNYTPHFNSFERIFTEWFDNTVNPVYSNIQLSHTLIYTLFTNSNLALDLPGNSSANGTKLQIYTSNNSAAQKFTFSPVENNYYVIKNQTGKVLDLPGGDTYNGNPIQLHNYNATCAQKWSLVRKPNGKYKILSACNGKKALDINGARTNKPGEKVQLWDDNGSVAQEWGLGNIDSMNYPIKTTVDYSIKSLAGSQLSYAADGGMTISNNSGASFRFQKFHSGLYRIVEVNSKKYVGYSDVSPRLTLNANADNPSNFWYLIKQGDKTIIHSQTKNFTFDISGGRISTDGEQVQAYTFNDSDAQKWTIEQLVTQPSNIQLSHTLIYTLFTNSNLALDLPGNSSANGTKLQIYTSNNSAAQKFTFSPVENNYYVIKNQTGKVLDLPGGDTYNGNPIQLHNYNATCAQKWSLVRKPNGKYKILSACNGKKALDINGARTNKPGEKVQLWDDNGSVAQEWGLDQAK